jgi:Domain of unknown function (DUF4070)
MRQASFFALFVGIESPDVNTLVSMKKKQNTRRNVTASIHEIYRNGMLVTGGFVLGFDSEKGSVANEMSECIESMSIPAAMLNLLHANPGTQFTRRLSRENRLHDHADVLQDHGHAGLNFETIRPRRDILSDYIAVLERVYSPAAYFGRVRTLGRLLNRPVLGAGPIRLMIRDFRIVLRLMWIMGFERSDLRSHFWRTFIDCTRHNFPALRYIMMMTALYLHHGPFSRTLIEHAKHHIALIDAVPSASQAKIVHAAVPATRTMMVKLFEKGNSDRTIKA